MNRDNSSEKRRPGTAETIVDGLNSIFRKIFWLIFIFMMLVFFLGLLVERACISNAHKEHQNSKPAAISPTNRKLR